MTSSDETVRQGVQYLKARFLNWRIPSVELPAESVIEDVVRSILNQRDEPTDTGKYLILFKERVHGHAHALWWGPNRSGYTINLDEAGRYTKDEAESIARVRDEDYPVPESAIGSLLKVRRVVCVDDADNDRLLKAYCNL